MPTPEEKAAADKAAAEKTTAAHGAAVEGAESVAKAVSRVADAAVAEVRKAAVAGPVGDFIVTGTPGGPFRIDGNGFGASGTVFFGGTQVETTEWSTSHIVGKLPAGLVAGEVVVHVDDKTRKTAQFKAA